MVGSHDDHFHLWKEVHKDIAHQLGKLQKVAQRLGEVEKRMGRLSIQVDGINPLSDAQRIGLGRSSGV